MPKLKLIRRSSTLYLALLLVLPITASCARRTHKSQIDAAAYQKELAQWQEQRGNELKSETGWLTLVGLFWLKEGPNKCGSEPTLDIVLPKEKVPLLFAQFLLERGRIFLQPLDDEIKIDDKPATTVLRE